MYHPFSKSSLAFCFVQNEIKVFYIDYLALYNTRSDPCLTLQLHLLSLSLTLCLKLFSHTGLSLSLKHTELTSAMDLSTVFSCLLRFPWLTYSLTLLKSQLLRDPFLELSISRSSITSQYYMFLFSLQPLSSPVIYLFAYYLPVFLILPKVETLYALITFITLRQSIMIAHLFSKSDY